MAHKELTPEKLAWACQDRLRRSRHKELVESLGLPVPDCLMPLRAKKGEPRIPKDELRKRKRAVDDALAFSEAVFNTEFNRNKKRKKRFVEKAAASSANEGARPETTEGVDGSLGQGSEDLDGLRVGERAPKEDNVHEIEYEILPSFYEFSQDMGTDCWALIGPAGGGKSVAVIMKMLQHASLHKEAKYVILRNTYRELNDTTMPTFFQWVPRELGKYDTQKEMFTLADRWEFYFRSCERAEDVDKFKGMEITGYFMNEAMEMKSDVKKLLDQRVGRFPMEEYTDKEGVRRKRGTSKVFRALDSNPPDQEHSLYDMFVKEPLDGHNYVLQPRFENEHNLPVGYYERMRESYRDSPDLIDRYIMGKWGAVYRGKAVYKDFDSRVHLARKPLSYVPGLRVYAGMDFGLTPSCVWTQVMPSGSWHIISEMCTDNTAADEFGDAVIAYTNQFFPNAEVDWYGDPAGFKRSETDAKSVVDVLAEKGIFMLPGSITIQARLESVRKRLRMRGGLVLSPSCVRLSTGFSGAYCFKQVAGTDYHASKPDKQNKWSHIHDALQYVASSIFSVGDTHKDDAFIKRMAEERRPLDSRVGY